MRGLAALTFVLAAASTSSREPAPDDDAGASPTLGVGRVDASLPARAGAILLGCGGGPESSCHGLGAGGMHLPDRPANLVDVPSTERPDLFRIQRGEPDRSYLWLKVVGDGGIDGGRMPLGRDPLGAEDRETLRSWIEAGAPSETP
jgi:hypothetical protein